LLANEARARVEEAAARVKAVAVAEARVAVTREVVETVVVVARVAVRGTAGQPSDNYFLCEKILRDLFLVNLLADM
jgi:hypothetical protein